MHDEKTLTIIILYMEKRGYIYITNKLQINSNQKKDYLRKTISNIDVQKMIKGLINEKELLEETNWKQH